MIDQKFVEYLETKAIDLRKMVLKMIHHAQSGHPGGSLSAADIITALYFHEMKIRPDEPAWNGRDRFVLSKGHVAPVLYSALILRGFIPESSVYTLRQYGSILQGHPDMKKTPGVDMSTGSLGQGLSTAVGMAVAGKRDQTDAFVYCLIGDGETNEGQIWEAVQTAVKYDLDNLIIIVDNNRLQNDGACCDIMPTYDLVAKFQAFGCDTYSVDGHNMSDILQIFEIIRNKTNNAPSVIVAQTVKGRGVSFMENVVKWHGVAPNDEEYAIAMQEVEAGLS